MKLSAERIMELLKKDIETNQSIIDSKVEEINKIYRGEGNSENLSELKESKAHAIHRLVALEYLVETIEKEEKEVN